MVDYNQYIPDPALTRLKNVKKIARGIAQVLGITAIIMLFVAMIVNYPQYVSYDKTDETIVTGEDNGFVALSYFGVDQAADRSRISSALLEEHLTALADNGFITITQQDLYDYYDNGTPLPERALFLLFEDGRRDTALYAQNALRDLNMKATMLTYAENLTTRRNLYLKSSELKKLIENTYWEVGTNGYRLSYINVSDRYGNYFGEMSTDEYILVRQYLERDYNHYLMDFIRDETGTPLESYSTMRDRLLLDYALMKQIYEEEIDAVPGLYVLMHSNTGAFGTNARASSVNEQAMRELFRVNFNREGYSLNTADTSKYDLTRMQPQSYWSTNHLLMRIWDDTDMSIDFVTGDTDLAAQWSILEGASEFKNNRLILTTLPSGSAVALLNGSDDITDLSLSVRLLGNALGAQRVWMRANHDATDGLAVEFWDGYLRVISVSGGIETEVYCELIDVVTGVTYVSLSEDYQNSLSEAITAKKRYASMTLENKTILSQLTESLSEEEVNTTQSGEDYVPTLELSTASDHVLSIFLSGDKLTVKVDDSTAVENLSIAAPTSGSILLESHCTTHDGAYSQRNYYDDVYDGVFQELTVTTTDGESTLYSYVPTKLALFQINLHNFWSNIVNWFIMIT